MNPKIIVGTRGSKLALWQANHLLGNLTALGHLAELKIIKTQGDKIQNLSFDKLEGKGFFTKELEDALLDQSIDIAVHSMKDVPTTQPIGLVLGAVSKRADPSDTLIVRKDVQTENRVFGLPENPVIGTSSFRRKSQILGLVPDAKVLDLRGNVPTRIRKLSEKQYDAIILAQAGLDRLALDLSEFITIKMHPKEFVPAPAQGVMAYQIREKNMALRKIVLNLHDEKTASCTNIERKVLKMMEGGCQLPLGVHCYRDAGGNYHAIGALAEGEQLHKTNVSQSTSVGLSQLIFDNLTK